MKIRTVASMAAIAVAASWLAVDSADASPFNPAGPLAQKKGKAQSAKAGKIGKKLQIAPRGLSWGLGNMQVAGVYDRYFDALYAQILADTPLGPQTEALTTELEDRKDLIRRNVLSFGTQKTGVDSTALKGEYSYRNNESMSKVSLNGGLIRYFFYFNDQLWKVYDEHQLRAGGPFGADFASAVQAVSTAFGAEPTRLEPDYAVGRNFEEARWTDGTTLLRLVNREHDQVAAAVYVDESVQSKLSVLRKNRPEQERLDHDVAEATAPKAPPPDPKKKK